MKYLWLAWKDKYHPAAGGAEVILHELSEALVKDGHDVTILTAKYSGAPKFETISGVKIIRIGGNRYIHPLAALIYYMRKLRGHFDVVIETVNTAPYFAALFRNKGRKPFLFYHQLAREIWHFEAPFPLNHLGYHIIEPLSTRLLGKSKAPTITISNSTKEDLIRHGFKENPIEIISEINHLEPIKDLQNIQKFEKPTILSLGAIRSMKRTLDQIHAFEIAKHRIPDLQMKLVGDASGQYGQEVINRINQSPYKQDIEYLGKVSHDDKKKIMQQAHLITVSSVKEGWGLIVTEAAGQGTPAVVYDVDGLRDSVKNLETGIVTAPNPTSLADGIGRALADNRLYNRMRHLGWQWSKEINLKKSYSDFKKAVGEYLA